MTDVIQLTTQPMRARLAAAPETFYFDLSLPATYLAAERVERRFGEIDWRAAVLEPAGVAPGEHAHLRTIAERRARELRMPLVWPERFPAAVPAAMRVATFAAECGACAAFVIAAGRLAFCGGYDIEDRAILADAAAAAGLDVKRALVAAGDPRRDVLSVAAGRELRARGVTSLPALRHDAHVYAGEERITAALLVHAPAVPDSPTAA
jgi:2-hydroxychromene-2-carboxylate isomerase